MIGQQTSLFSFEVITFHKVTYSVFKKDLVLSNKTGNGKSIVNKSW